MAAVRHPGFLKGGNFTAGPIRRANMHQCAKFRVDCVNRSGDMTVFQCFKMPAVRHLGFLEVRNFSNRSDRKG